MWCVGVCLSGGEHRYFVFDSEAAAQLKFDDLVRRGCTPQREGRALRDGERKVFIWAM